MAVLPCSLCPLALLLHISIRLVLLCCSSLPGPGPLSFHRGQLPFETLVLLRHPFNRLRLLVRIPTSSQGQTRLSCTRRRMTCDLSATPFGSAVPRLESWCRRALVLVRGGGLALLGWLTSWVIVLQFSVVRGLLLGCGFCTL